MSGCDNSEEQGAANLLAIEEPRAPRNLQDLLRYAVEAGGNNVLNNNSPQPLDPERRRFLEEVLQSMTVDIAKELSDAINTLRKLQSTESDQCDESDYVSALEKIADFVDNIDAANDFYKLGGFEIVGVCLASSSPSIRWRIADIVAQCTQNNPFCQMHAVSMNLLQPLLLMVDHDEDNDCRVKAFFAVASIVRDNPDGLKQFLDLDGFFIVLRGMKSPVEKLRIKTTFFLSTMISKHPEIKETLLKMGFVEQIIALIREEHSTNHEHLASALLSLVENYEPAQIECRRPEFELRLSLQNLLNEHSNNEAFQEEMGYVKSLLKTLFSDDPEGKR